VNDEVVTDIIKMGQEKIVQQGVAISQYLQFWCDV
jgi:hypothetical protein